MTEAEEEPVSGEFWRTVPCARCGATNQGIYRFGGALLCSRCMWREQLGSRPLSRDFVPLTVGEKRDPGQHYFVELCGSGRPPVCGFCGGYRRGHMRLDADWVGSPVKEE